MDVSVAAITGFREVVAMTVNIGEAIVSSSTAVKQRNVIKKDMETEEGEHHMPVKSR